MFSVQMSKTTGRPLSSPNKIAGGDGDIRNFYLILITIPTDRPLALLVTATCHWCTKVNAEQVVVIVNVTVTVIIIIMH